MADSSRPAGICRASLRIKLIDLHLLLSLSNLVAVEPRGVDLLSLILLGLRDVAREEFVEGEAPALLESVEKHAVSQLRLQTLESQPLGVFSVAIVKSLNVDVILERDPFFLVDSGLDDSEIDLVAEFLV